MRLMILALPLALTACAGLPIEAINDRLAAVGEQYRSAFGTAYDRGKALLCLDMPVAVVQAKNPTAERMAAFSGFCEPPVVALPAPPVIAP